MRLLMDTESTFVIPVGDVNQHNHGQYIVQHTWIASGPLGFKIMSRHEDPDSTGGVIVSEKVDGSLPEAIMPGMSIESLNGTDVRKISFTEVTAMLKTMGRPLTVRFRSTVEHAVLESLKTKFLDADVDESGALSKEELAEVIRQVHREEGVKRSLEVVEREVDEMMARFDESGSGQLEFLEFVCMTCRAPNFKFKLSEEQKRNVIDLCEIMATKMASEPKSPLSRRARHLEQLPQAVREPKSPSQVDLSPTLDPGFLDF